MEKPWPIEIDGLPINSMVMFHGYVKAPDGISNKFNLHLPISTLTCLNIALPCRQLFSYDPNDMLVCPDMGLAPQH